MAAKLNGCDVNNLMWRIFLLFWLFSGLIDAEDLYSNSFLSPNSADNDVKQHASEIRVDVTTILKEIPVSSHVDHILPQATTVRKERSANPIVFKPSEDIDLLTASKNIADNLDSNDVEYSGRIAPFIQPSKTETPFNSNELVQSTVIDSISGEAQGAPQGRSLPLSESLQATPTIATTTQNFATPSYLHVEKGRQSNPDIQDIITGIVKLLNGNVNVQANTAPALGRPTRPISTRINNRGPPRITDVPALPPDFDIPAEPPLPPSKTVTPYPFDSVMLNTSPARPYMPVRSGVTRPNWSNRPPNRRPGGPYRRPKPPFKPIPIFTSDEKTSTSTTTTTEKVTTEEAPTPNEEQDDIVENTTEIVDEVETATTIADEDIDYEKNKEKSTSKLNKHTVISTTVNTENKTNILPTAVTSSSITATFINTTDIINDTKIITSATLEPSVVDVTHITSTKTQQLPQILSTNTIQPILNINTSKTTNETTTSLATETTFSYLPYRPRPGIVLDDTEYKPGGVHRQPIITAQPTNGHLGDIFDITVSAIQGPNGASSNDGKPFVIPVDIEHLQTQDIITSPIGNEGFVSIDGKRTYLNLFGEPTDSLPIGKSPTISATSTSNTITGTGYAVAQPPDKPKPAESTNVIAVSKPTSRRPLYNRRPSQPPVRIDTCIVGDDSTCDTSQHEFCKTESGVSACHCRPGHARRKHRDPCRKIVSILLSLRIDRLYERRVVWANELGNHGSESYQQLSYETERAMESAMSMTPFSDEFLGIKVNNVYKGDRSAGQAGVFVNLTLQLEANTETTRATVRNDIQKHLLGVIQRRSNNVGNSAVWVDSPPGSVSHLQDLDECASSELHDCHTQAKCINVFGGFKCECGEGLKDPFIDNKHRAGRHCEQCSAQHCNNRGHCKYQNGQEVCVCIGNYYGAQCEVDGEILGVAIGASVAAVIIIGLTLVCLVMWSRRWNREQKAGATSPVFGYMATAGSTVKTPVVGGPPYQVTMEDRIRWAQIADVMAQSNHYAPEPVTAPTRPSSAMFGYPNLSFVSTLQRGTFHGTLPPVPLPRLGLQAQLAARAASVQGMKPLDNSSSSEEEDRTDLLGRFQVPRPKSRSNASIANQSGIYYDVDYEHNEGYKQGCGIPMNTYAITRPYYRS